MLYYEKVRQADNPLNELSALNLSSEILLLQTPKGISPGQT
jgi:hypothetical protein